MNFSGGAYTLICTNIEQKQWSSTQTGKPPNMISFHSFVIFSYRKPLI